MYCNSSRVRLVCFHMRHGKVIAYTYIQVKVHKRNSVTHDLELAVIVFTWILRRHYLYGVHMDVFSEKDSSIYVHSKGAESPTKKVFRILEG